MSAKGGRAPGLREIPPAPATYRLKTKEPSGHTFHPYMPPRDLEYTASRECPSLATVAVLMAFAHRTDVDGVTRTGIREIARHLDRSPGTIHRHVTRLLELGFLEQLGGCREDNRHRLWRVAGMDRRDKVGGGPGDNHHRGAARSRAGGERHAARSFAGGERLPVQLPGELIEPTRASPQQEPPAPRDWGRAEGVGIRAAREALRARGAPGGAPGGPGPPSAVSDDGSDPEAGTEAQNGTDSTAEGAA